MLFLSYLLKYVRLTKTRWLVGGLRQIQRYFRLTGQLASFQIMTCRRAPNAMGS